MPKEKEAYRDNLEQILNYSKGNQLLSIGEVSAFTGKDRRTVTKLYPFKDKTYITAATLARAMS